MAGASLNVNLDLGDILDANQNEMLEFDAVASAVNFFRLANSGTGDRVVFSSQGDDDNVGIDIDPKGTGDIRFLTATAVLISTDGMLSFAGLGRSDTHFVVRTASQTPLTVAGRTTANTTWIPIRLDSTTGTVRYLQVYD